MVHLYLCGSGGSGKTTLSNKLTKGKVKGFIRIQEVARRIMAEKKLDEVALKKMNFQEFLSFQKLILNRQAREEERKRTDNVISDRSILDCLAFSLWRMENKFLKRKEEQVSSDNLEKLINVNFADSKETISKCLSRYRASLTILVHPWNLDSNNSEKDGVRLSMNSQELERFSELMKMILENYHIPYVDMREPYLERRIDTVMDALHGTIPRKSCILENYGEQKKEQMESHDTNIAFFLQKSDHRGSKSNKLNLKTVSFYEDHYKLCFSSHSSRFSQKYGCENLILFQFDMKMTSKAVKDILCGKIRVNGEEYSFLGCSTSGLKERNAFLWKGSRGDAEKVLQDCGGFHLLKQVSKRMARIGLLFSGVCLTDIVIDDTCIIKEDDILSPDGEYNFTDGCGGISTKLAQKLSGEISKDPRNHVPVTSYIPSVFQIRLQGIKGVLAVDPTLNDHSVLIRPSMTKFQTTAFPVIVICDSGFSQPYTFGHLNRQLIYLLSALGVPDESFISIQHEYFEIIGKMLWDPEAAISVLQWKNKFDAALQILKLSEKYRENFVKSFKSQNQDIVKELVAIRDKMVHDVKEKRGEIQEKLKIMVKKSRQIYAICDQSRKLEYGQCFVRLTINGIPKTITGKVISFRSPSYLLGDVRVLEAVDIPNLHHLVDCIVFPVKGKRPHADEQSGGDLDGDKFFVSWDERLIPAMFRPPQDYPAAISRRERPVNVNTMIDYFSVQNGAKKITGKLANLFESWADVKGADSDECQRIGMLFGRAIDSAKSGEKVNIPKDLENPPEDIERAFVWHKLEDNARKFKRKICKNVILNAENVTEDFIMDVIYDQDSNVNDFEKLKLVWSFAKLNFERTEQAMSYVTSFYADKFNFSVFSMEEKIFAIDVGIPATIVQNSLWLSEALTKEDMDHFGLLKKASNLGFSYRASRTDFEFEKLVNIIANHDHSLILLQMPNNVTIGLEFLMTFTEGEKNEIPPYKMKSFFVSPHFGTRRISNIGDKMKYNLTKDYFQIYKGNERNSFLWFKENYLPSTVKDRNYSIDPTNANTGEALSINLRMLGLLSRIIMLNGYDRNHPLIKKSPVLGIEVFASRDNVPAYPDILLGNDLLHDPEEVEAFENIVEVDTIDRFGLVMESLKNVESSGDNDDKSFKDILAHIVSIAYPVNRDYIKEKDVTEKVIALIESGDTKLTFDDWFTITKSLCKLGLRELVTHNNIPEDSLSIDDAIKILRDGIDLLWYLQPNILMPIFRECLLNENDSDSPNCHFIKRIIWNSLIEIENDLTKSKEDITRDAIFGMKFGNIVEKDSQGNTEKNLISLYKTSTVDRKLIPAIGSFVTLYRYMDRKCDRSVSITCLAKVMDVYDFPFHVDLRLMEDLPMLIENELKDPTYIWCLGNLKDTNITLFSRILNSSARLLSSPMNDNVSSVLFSRDNFNREDGGEIDIVFPDLNEVQKRAVKAAINDSVTIIQGPPGTGKTKVACTILTEMAKKESIKILAVAETNNAVDNITRCLVQMNQQILRVGNKKEISTDLFEHSLEGKLKLAEEKEKKKYEKQIGSGKIIWNKAKMNEIIKDAKIILTTSAGAGDSTLDNYDFDFVLVDEATQTKENTLICTLSHNVKQLVLIGDPKQLGPFVSIEENWNWLTNEERQMAVLDLEQTLFHKLYAAGNVQVHFLNTQYRMHPEIAKFSSLQFYGGKLETGVSVADRIPPWKNITEQPNIFFDVEGCERRKQNSYCNYEEIKVVQDIIDKLKNFGKENLVVLSLYRMQVQELKAKLGASLNVCTVDSFQGREAEVVIISTVRSNQELVNMSSDKTPASVPQKYFVKEDGIQKSDINVKELHAYNDYESLEIFSAAEVDFEEIKSSENDFKDLVDSHSGSERFERIAEVKESGAGSTTLAQGLQKKVNKKKQDLLEKEK